MLLFPTHKIAHIINDIGITYRYLHIIVNPDIGDYMGNFELTGAYKLDTLEFVLLGRRSFKEIMGF